MNNNIKRFPMAFASIGNSLALIHCLAFVSNLPPAKGAALPEINLLVPDYATHRKIIWVLEVQYRWPRIMGERLGKNWWSKIL